MPKLLRKQVVYRQIRIRYNKTLSANIIKHIHRDDVQTISSYDCHMTSTPGTRLMESSFNCVTPVPNYQNLCRNMINLGMLLILENEILILKQQLVILKNHLSTLRDRTPPPKHHFLEHKKQSLNHQQNDFVKKFFKVSKILILR